METGKEEKGLDLNCEGGLVEEDSNHQWSCPCLSFTAWILSLSDWEDGA